MKLNKKRPLIISGRGILMIAFWEDDPDGGYWREFADWDMAKRELKKKKRPCQKITYSGWMKYQALNPDVIVMAPFFPVFRS